MRVLTISKVVIFTIIIIITTVDFCSSARARTKTGSRPVVTPKKNGGQSIAVNPERVKLLEDALSWLTLRKKGKLLTQKDNKPFLDLLVDKYKKSKFYRTLVIAFQHGVLPKLTLNAGANCNPVYTSYFRNPFNKSVTDYSIKNFTFQSYYARNNPHKMGGSAFCDYRKGLRCNPATKKCECPPGSKMSPVGGTSSTREACLLEKEENCALIDLDHHDTHNFLKHYLPSMIFNLDKPLGCQDNLHCRFNVDGYEFPKCYSEEYEEDFEAGDVSFDYGRPCTLHLYTDDRGGMCGKDLTCYKFGPRSYPDKPMDALKLGHCAREQGEFIGVGAGRQTGKGQKVFDMQPFVIPFVNPRTTPWTSVGSQLDLSTYLGKLQEVNKKYFKATQQNKGGPCSMGMTKKMGELWEFYVGLEKQPPAGKKFVASAAELQEKLGELQNLLKGKGKICRVNMNIATSGGLSDNIGPAMKCVRSGSPADADGNDGTCTESPSSSTTMAAHKLKEFLDYENKVRDAIASEEQNYDESILRDFPEGGCTPQVGLAEPIVAGKARHHQVDILEGGVCPQGSVCYENLDDARGIYMGTKCHFIPSYKPEASCHDVKEGLSSFGKCEQEVLKIRVMEALAGVHDHSMLGRGDTCRFDIEQKIKQAITGEKEVQNPYAILSMINVAKSRGGFCDPTRLLECRESNICECIKDTRPRSAEDGTTSDHCYLIRGSCRSDLKKLLPTSATQKEMIKRHYGNLQEIEENCKNGNICMFVDSKAGQCTSENTGRTGYEADPRLDRSVKSKGTRARGNLGMGSVCPEIFKVLLIIRISNLFT